MAFVNRKYSPSIANVVKSKNRSAATVSTSIVHSRYVEGYSNWGGRQSLAPVRAVAALLFGKSLAPVRAVAKEGQFNARWPDYYVGQLLECVVNLRSGRQSGHKTTRTVN